MEDVMTLFPEKMRRMFGEVNKLQKDISEIRIRVGSPVTVYCSGREMFLSENGNLSFQCKKPVIFDRKEISALFDHICNYSAYAYEEELRKGYITVRGGFRVGVAGQTVAEKNGTVRNIKNISSLNIRVPHEMKGAADEVLPALFEKGILKNTLIISPPGCGKTTMLRDLVRQVSDGSEDRQGKNVAVVDERGEIAGCHMGVPQNDVGMRTDILEGCDKVNGILMLLRSMGPQVIAVDELGSPEEWETVQRAGYCGVNVIATVHGNDIDDVYNRFPGSKAVCGAVFQRMVVLGKTDGKCTVKYVKNRS